MGDDHPADLQWSSVLGIGAVLAGVLVAGVALGWWVDGLLHTSPIFVLVGIALGIAGGIWHTVIALRRYLKN
ncbi:MAG: putative F0F1-ATPase subunit Ca2+/Mg2+ transporter [Pseudonocardiales bacterium]|nr:putative F0F1-ATPase subunit Ca2+/Mg2+ transporter [Pseudonocardiales bacterium]MDT4909353.1 putative F0F1-ATPase subunit Ca2+/Mg2+ transporter [Pseudonocardiales bacterium]MDT4964801.1 putative F0F1-ATPase subunit Ca2+/Mg2+ transporter [Pseudonocardiales bacterium]MDT4971531.1 putative F0F1-ATPase subunit Ca2+/Mg2+ transporter [Pseudonocardiales bacterium]MDT4976761.1 putative F0F1-ATPase subunit Ca2+/Mg2+ transporter [Pseudonocardiales bacterium]